MDDAPLDRPESPVANTTDRRSVVRGLLGTAVGSLLVGLGLPPEFVAATTTAGIAEAINAYRVSKGLLAIPVSTELTTVARTHINDLLTYHPDLTCGSMHSWSNNGSWSGGCYDSADQSTWPIMWNKPREIAGYPGSGYEISAKAPQTITADRAVQLWSGSPGHNAVMLNQGTWASYPWGALGGWAAGEYACAWFGEESGTPPDEQPVTNPSGTTNPSFAGARATTTSAFDSPNTGTANSVRDSSLSTSWWTASTSPLSATLTLDLGSAIALTGIKWRWNTITNADQFDVQVASSISGPWTTIGRFGNGTSISAWFGIATSRTARFVRFLFANPNGDTRIGGMAEVEIWRAAAVTNPPGTVNPAIPGEKIRLTNAFDSPNTGNANKVRDGSHSSNWSTAQNRPSSASVTVDLGSSTRITGIRWLWTSLGYADQFDLQVSTSSSGPWTTLGRYGNGTATYTWFGTTANTTARFVRFLFGNPNRDLVLGALGEIEVFKPGATSNPPGTPNPSVSGYTKQPVTNVFDSPNTGTAGRVKDGTSYTNWAVQGRPGSATITLDMGSSRPINVIRWMMSSLGYADQFQVRVATAFGSWTTLGTFGNPTTTRTWFGIVLPAARTARFVQLAFANPNGDSALGAVGEIDIWGAPPVAAAAAALPNATANPVFAGQALPIDDTTVNGGDVVARDETSVSFSATADSVTTILETAENDGLTGARWTSVAGITVTLAVSVDGTTWTPVTTVATIANGPSWQGVAFRAGPDTRYVRVQAQSESPGSLPQLNDLEIWGVLAEPGTPTPTTTPGTPTPTPTATPDTPTETPGATAVPTETVTPEPTTQPTEEPVPTEEPIESTEPPTEEPIPTVEPTEEPTEEPVATEAPVVDETPPTPTPTPTPTEESAG